MSDTSDNVGIEFDQDEEIDHSSLGYRTRWNYLRVIGNSPITRASIIVPILGYLILFHNDLINYLRLHVDFCDGCKVSWRLHFLYFGSCSFAVGALIYGAYCPPLIKRYSGATDFFDAEKYYFTNKTNFEYLRSLIKRDRKTHRFDPKILASLPEVSETLGNPTDLYFLGGVMGQHYVLQNMSYPVARKVVWSAYMLGALLIATPTVWTFVQILGQAMESVTN